jgi:hypothetical protein
LTEVSREEKPPVKVRSAEQLMVSAIYMAGKRGRTWKQACGIFRGLCEKQGTKDKVPSSVTVGGHRYRCPRYGSDDSNRRVAQLYPFTVNQGHGGEYLIPETETVGSPY